MTRKAPLQRRAGFGFDVDFTADFAAGAGAGGGIGELDPAPASPPDHRNMPQFGQMPKRPGCANSATVPEGSLRWQLPQLVPLTLATLGRFFFARSSW
ncbi:hypothetical protein DB347_09060 [Opitutaceae bacterium EW11]|nr:hypothetical protein DB347_09060 [Opitutaceae bacterium EW11]